MKKKRQREGPVPMTKAQKVAYLERVKKWMNTRGKTLVTDPVDQHALDRYRHMFDMLDENENGFLQASDLIKALRFIGIRASEDEMSARLQMIDDNSDGNVDFNEFVNFMQKGIFDSVVDKGVNAARSRNAVTGRGPDEDLDMPFYLWIPAFLRRRDITFMIETGSIPESMKMAVKFWTQLDADIERTELDAAKRRKQKSLSRTRISRKLDALRTDLVQQARRRRALLKFDDDDIDDAEIEELLRAPRQEAVSLIDMVKTGENIPDEEEVPSREDATETDVISRAPKSVDTKKQHKHRSPHSRFYQGDEQYLSPRQRIQRRLVSGEFGTTDRFERLLYNQRRQHFGNPDPRVSLFPMWSSLREALYDSQQQMLLPPLVERQPTAEHSSPSHTKVVVKQRRKVELPCLKRSAGPKRVRKIAARRKRELESKREMLLLPDLMGS